MFLALRELRHEKLRFALITGVIVLVSSLVFILSGLANGLSAGNTAAIDAMPIDAIVLSSGSNYLLDRSSLPADSADTIGNLAGIRLAEALGVSSENIRAQGSDDIIGVSFFGLAPQSVLTPGISHGNDFAGQPNGVVIDETLSENGIKLGDTFLTDPGGVELTVVGVTTGHSYRLAPTVYMPLTLWQQLRSPE
ncbi:MAG TPA: ABC transporter permease, partial [Thermomicrobiales bacterium]|nr:ABC transporter permease [Thermomicrobiales bacterium]